MCKFSSHVQQSNKSHTWSPKWWVLANLRHWYVQATLTVQILLLTESKSQLLSSGASMAGRMEICVFAYIIFVNAMLGDNVSMLFCVIDVGRHLALDIPAIPNVGMDDN